MVPYIWGGGISLAYLLVDDHGVAVNVLIVSPYVASNLFLFYPAPIMSNPSMSPTALGIVCPAQVGMHDSEAMSKFHFGCSCVYAIVYLYGLATASTAELLDSGELIYWP